ncbi:flagellar hook-associated protein FlgK [candidate division KSB1 bacterium]|nr:flagellar hook-associated protein FlgK [candidate division KSB1 bacterium]
MSGFGIRSALDIGRKTLRAQLAGLNVTANNIANVNTPSYSRQEVSIVSDIPITTSEGIFGTGVKIDGVRRIRDNLVDRQLRNEMHSKGRNDILERIYNQLETTINEPSDTGLRSLMSRFFDNFHNLANDPENATTRFNLRESGNLLSEAFHRLDKQLRVLSDDIDFELRRGVENLNRLSGQVAKLNSQIVSLEGTAKGTANDLRDERDRALDDLSELLDIFALEKRNGIVDVAASEQTLVSSNFPLELEVQVRNDKGNLKSDIIVKNNRKKFTVKNGKLAGMLEARNVIIPHFRDLFDSLAKNIIDRVNNVHRAGVGLQGNSSEIPKDNDFFEGDSSSNINISFAIKADVANIAAASRIDILQENGEVKTTGSPGDNNIAIQIADLKQALILAKGTKSLLDSFNEIVSEIGIEAKKAHDNVTNEDLLIQQFKNFRDSVSGVSLDEEFINLIKFQRGFQAGAKIITTVDQMFETLINM